VKTFELLFVKLGQRGLVPVEPSTESADERTLLTHRPPAIALTDTERQKPSMWGVSGPMQSRLLDTVTALI
jgi:hypothetical protein